MPELDRKEKRERAVGSKQSKAAFDEERREIDLRSETLRGAGDVSPRLPRGRAGDKEIVAKAGSRGWWNSMQPYPMGIPNDEIESTARLDISEVDGERE